MSEDDYHERASLVEAAGTGDHLTLLEALLDNVLRELEGNRCSKCHATQMRTGDYAALTLRAMKLSEEIREIKTERGLNTPEVSDELDADGKKGVVSLDSIRNRRGPAAGRPEAEDSDTSKLGTKAAPRRSREGRRDSQSRYGSGGAG